MSEASDAMAELQREMDDFLGKPQTVRINGKSYPARPSEITYDPLKVPGGDSDTGGGRVDIDMAYLLHEPSGEIEVDGNTWDILQVVNTNDVTWTITYGRADAE